MQDLKYLLNEAIKRLDCPQVEIERALDTDHRMMNSLLSGTKKRPLKPFEKANLVNLLHKHVVFKLKELAILKREIKKNFYYDCK